MLENDGNQPLDLTGFTPDSNAQLDPSTTTCGTGSPYLTQDTACYIGAIFAPSLTSIGDPLFANIDVAAVSVNAVNAPLDIVLAGDATAINSTTTVLTSSLNPSNYGQSVTFTAAVTTGPNTGILDGTVTFVDTSTGITLQSAVPVNSVGRAFYTTTNLAVGTHNITASYSGDTLHSASSTTTALAQVVNEGTTTTLVSSANPALLGANVTFTATVTAPGGGGVVPIGTVVFTDGSTVLATVTLNGSAVATYSTSTLAVGPHAISAAYSGSTPYYVSASTSATLNQDVQATSVTTLVSSLNPSTYGASITLTSVVTSNGTIVPTGTVDINDGTTRIGTVSLAGTTGVATWTVSSLIVGSHTLTAYYEGNPYNAPSTSAPVVQVVSPAQTTTVVTATPDPGIAGRAVRLTATITETNGSGQITGTVTFTEGTTNLGTVAVSGGAASISPVLAPGAHTIVATYSGDRNNSASVSAAFPITVILATTSTTIASSASPAIVLSSITFTASVAGNGGMPTGVVTFSADGATIGTGTLNASGVATFSTSTLGVGSHTITASYGGDVDDSSSSSAALTQIVGSIPTTTGLGASATAGPNPQTIFVATVVGASGPTPTGTVTFTDGSKFIGSSTLDSTGVATLSPDLATGSYNVVASYGGDAIHGPSTSQTELISSTAAGFNIVVAPPNLTLAVSQNGTLGITVSSNNNFADTIGLGCSSVPFAVNCHFSSNTINLAAGGSQTIQLTIDTNNPLSGGTTAMNASKGSSSLAGLFFPASLVFGIVCWRFRRKNAVVLTALLVLLFSGATLATGCSGGFSQSTAAPGTYSIQVTGVGANSNITHYGTVTLTITK
jgi:hypothetical protein